MSGGRLEETFELTKPKAFQAMVDAMLNMMYEFKRQDFKELEVRTYIFHHWNTLMFGWPPLEAERSPTGRGKKFRNGNSFQPEFHKKSSKHRKCKEPVFQSSKDRDACYRLCDLRPRQPMNILQSGER